MRRTEDPGHGGGSATPRDLPDQQVQEKEDPWDTPLPPSEDAEGKSDESVPDPDEAGAGRGGAPEAGSGLDEDPVPDEPSG